MKKGLLIFGVTSLVILGMSSCKKDYTCKCDITMTGILNSTMTADSVIKDTKAKAKSKCEALGSTTTETGETTTVTCSIQ